MLGLVVTRVFFPTVIMNKRSMKKVFPLLRVLSKLSPKEREAVICHLMHSACDGIYACIENGLTNPTLKDADKRQLQTDLIPHKRTFRRLIKEKSPEKKKRHLLKVGDGAGLILEKVVPLLQEYLEPK